MARPISVETSSFINPYTEAAESVGKVGDLYRGFHQDRRQQEAHNREMDELDRQETMRSFAANYDPRVGIDGKGLDNVTLTKVREMEKGILDQAQKDYEAGKDVQTPEELSKQLLDMRSQLATQENVASTVAADYKRAGFSNEDAIAAGQFAASRFQSVKDLQEQEQEDAQRRFKAENAGLNRLTKLLTSDRVGRSTGAAGSTIKSGYDPTKYEGGKFIVDRETAREEIDKLQLSPEWLSKWDATGFLNMFEKAYPRYVTKSLKSGMVPLTPTEAIRSMGSTDASDDGIFRNRFGDDRYTGDEADIMSHLYVNTENLNAQITQLNELEAKRSIAGRSGYSSAGSKAPREYLSDADLQRMKTINAYQPRSQRQILEDRVTALYGPMFNQQDDKPTVEDVQETAPSRDILDTGDGGGSGSPSGGEADKDQPQTGSPDQGSSGLEGTLIGKLDQLGEPTNDLNQPRNRTTRSTEPGNLWTLDSDNPTEVRDARRVFDQLVGREDDGSFDYSVDDIGKRMEALSEYSPGTARLLQRWLEPIMVQDSVAGTVRERTADTLGSPVPQYGEANERMMSSPVGRARAIYPRGFSNSALRERMTDQIFTEQTDRVNSFRQRNAQESTDRQNRIDQAIENIRRESALKGIPFQETEAFGESVPSRFQNLYDPNFVQNYRRGIAQPTRQVPSQEMRPIDTAPADPLLPPDSERGFIRNVRSGGINIPELRDFLRRRGRLR